jgi:hypothetical protein
VYKNSDIESAFFDCFIVFYNLDYKFSDMRSPTEVIWKWQKKRYYCGWWRSWKYYLKWFKKLYLTYIDRIGGNMETFRINTWVGKFKMHLEMQKKVSLTHTFDHWWRLVQVILERSDRTSEWKAFKFSLGTLNFCNHLNS